MVTIQVPNFCTIKQVCQKLGFTYYTVSYWLDHNMVKWIPAGSKKLINMEDLNRFLNGEEVKQSDRSDERSGPDPVPAAAD